MKAGSSPMNGSNSPMTDGSSVTTPTSLTGTTSPVLSPTNGMKKPKLRVQIPTEAKENSTLAGAIKEEESSELPPIQKRPLEPAPMSSTLPSQFAKNLPSPSTFYPEFYASQAELSPIVFGQTPTSAQPGSAFNWPVPPRVHQPSPLAKASSGDTSGSASTKGTSGSNLRISSTAGEASPSTDELPEVGTTRARSSSDIKGPEGAPVSKKIKKE